MSWTVVTVFALCGGQEQGVEWLEPRVDLGNVHQNIK